MHAVNLKIWASVDQVADFLSTPSLVSKLVKTLNAAVCLVGYHASEEDRHPAAPPFCWPCICCSTALTAGGHFHKGERPPVKMSSVWGNLHHIVHKAIVQMELVLSILSWKDDKLAHGQDVLIEELLKAPRDGRPLSEHTMEAIIRGVQFEDTGFLLSNLVGVIDNCLSVAPKAAHLAVSLCGVLISKRPASCLETLDPKPLSHALFKHLGLLSRSLMNPQCRVDCWFATAFLLNSIPVFYHLSDWKEARACLQEAMLPETLGSLSINLLHTATQKASAGKFDCRLPYQEFPELRSINLSVSNILIDAGPAVVDSLRKNPLLFAAVSLFEVLGRWQWRGVDCMSSRIPCEPSQDVIRRDRLNRQQIVSYTEPLSDSFLEYDPRLKEAVKADGVFSYILPIYDHLSKGDRPALPPSTFGSSLLRASLSYSSQCCSLPGCTSRRRRGGEGDEPLLLCTGGCQGLARYCCEEHQLEDWKCHKFFCKRQDKGVGGGQGTKVEKGGGQGTKVEKGGGQGTKDEKGGGQGTKVEKGGGQETKVEKKKKKKKKREQTPQLDIITPPVTVNKKSMPLALKKKRSDAVRVWIPLLWVALIVVAILIIIAQF